MHRISLARLLILAALLIGAVLVGRIIFTPPYPPPPRPGTGAVIGRLDLSSHANMPYNAKDLYLGTLVPANQPNMPPVISFTYGVDPQTVVHEPDGRFAFTNVPPNTYALIVWTPVGGFPIEPLEGGFIRVTVEADKVTDLGTVVLP